MAVRRRLLVPAVVTAIVVVAVVVAAAMLVQGRDGASSAAPEPPVPSRMDELDPAVAEAIRKAVGEIRRDPGDVQKRLRLGMLYAANDCIESAAATLQQAIALGCEDARAWYHLALVQAELGDLHAALASARAAASRRDDMAPVHWRQGFWWLELGDTGEAEAAFGRARRIDPDHPAAILGLARVHLQRGEHETAAALLEPLAQRPSVNLPYTHHLLGTAYRGMGRMAEAEAALARGRGRPPSWSDPWHDELDRYRYGHLAELDRAKARFQAGDVRGAVELLERVKRTGTVTAQVHENLALCYLALGQRRRAVAELRQGLELSPDGMQSNYLLAGAYHLEMDKAPAASRDELHRLVLHHVDRALKAAPTYAPAHGLKAEMLAIDSDIPGAIEAYREAARWDPENADWLFEAARLHGRLRQWPQAVECLEQVTRLRPDHAEAHGRLGVAYMAMDRLDEAEQALLTARRLDPALDQRIRAALEQVRARRLAR